MKIQAPLPLPPKDTLSRMAPEDRAEWAQWASDLDMAYRARLITREQDGARWGLVMFVIGVNFGVWVIAAFARIW